MSKISKGAKELNSMDDHEEFLQRIKKTLYYGKLPRTDRLSLPVTEMASELFSKPQSKRTINRLHPQDAAYISLNACVTPCSFVLAVLYLERLKCCNPDYLYTIAPRELFLVTLLVSSKFLYDCGGMDEVIMDEWSVTGNICLKKLIILEREFLKAIDWQLYVDNENFLSKLSAIESELALKEGSLRGYFTYTELNNLLSIVEIHMLLNYLTKLMAVLLATYMAAVLTIYGSISIVSNVPGNSIKPVEFKEVIETPPITIETDLEAKNQSKNCLNVLDVFKTGIILASIKTNPQENYTENENVEYVSWDWWTSSTMDWLSKSSMLIETLQKTIFLNKFTFNRFIDMTIAETKIIGLQDQLHKGTTLRIQDQLEQSWHVEWIDTIEDFFIKYRPVSYSQEIKV